MIRAGLSLLLLTTSASAEPWSCQMTVQCDNLDCIAIADSYSLIAADHAGELFLSSATGDHPVTRLSPQNHLPAAYAGVSTHAIAELLTIVEDGQAVLTSHGHDGSPRTITTFGTCTPL